MRIRRLLFLSLLPALLSLATAAKTEERSIRIGLVSDGPWYRSEELQSVFQQEIRDLLVGEFDVVFSPDHNIVADWTPEGINSSIDLLLADPEVDMIIGLGPIVSTLAAERTTLVKPVIAPFVVDAAAITHPLVDGGSGIPNLTYFAIPTVVKRDIRLFSDIVPFRKLVVFTSGSFTLAFPDPCKAHNLETLADEVVQIPVFHSAEEALAQVPEDADAVYLFFLPMPDSEFRLLAQGLIDRKLPSYSLIGRMDVDRGIMAGLLTDNILAHRARRTALTIQRILLGEKPETIPVSISVEQRLCINMATARAIDVSPPWSILNEADLVNDLRKEVNRRLNLSGVMHEAVLTNLDLAARSAGTAAGRSDVKISRSALLPHLDLAATGAWIDKDRAEASMGQAAERTYSGTAALSQVLFSEPAWAGYSAQKSLQTGREKEWETLRLDIARDAAVAYLNVLSTLTLERIQKQNLKLTRKNLELAKVRLSLGVAGPAEVYRWEAEIARGREELIRANGLRNLAEMELNRILHKPIEDSFICEDIGVDDPAFLLKTAPPYVYIGNRKNFRLLREYLARLAVDRSTELKMLDAAITAEERILVSRKRRFYTPTLAIQGEVENIFQKEGAGTEGGIDPASIPADFSFLAGAFGETPDDWNWQVGLSLTLPLYEGGSMYASRDREREKLNQLKGERAAVAERIEMRIRSALHMSGVSYAGIRLTRETAEAARKTYEVVEDAYSRGASSLLDLLDAQNASNNARLSASIATYRFLTDYMEVQRSIGRFDVFYSDSEKQQWTTTLEKYILENGGSLPPKQFD